jgi:hypothetical protein
MLGKSNKKYYKSNLLCATLLAMNILDDSTREESEYFARY